MWNWAEQWCPVEGGGCISDKISIYYQMYLLSELVYVHEVYTGTEWVVPTIQECVLNQLLTIRVGLYTWGIHRDRMRSSYCPGVCTKPATYYQSWFMYMRYTQGQNEEYLLSRSMYWTRYLLSGLVYVHEVHTGTEWGVPTIQECVLNQVLAKQVLLYSTGTC